MPESLSCGNPFPQDLDLRREMAEIQSKYHRIIVGNKDLVHNNYNNLLYQENYLRVVLNQSAKRIISCAPLTHWYKLYFRGLSGGNDLFMEDLWFNS